jgi:Ni/Co efflux regulator RcnB
VIDGEQIRVHFASGKSADTVISADELDEWADGRPEFLDVEEPATVEDYVSYQLNNPPKPHWIELGSLYFFTQAVEAVEVL